MNRTIATGITLIGLLIIATIAYLLHETRNITRQEGGRSYGYEVREAPAYFYTGMGSRRKLYWVDNERVLFLGLSERQRNEPTIIGGRQVYGVKLWNTQTGEIQEIGKALGDLCYFRGELSYLVSFDDNQVVRRRGSLESTTEVISAHKDEMTDALVARGERNHPFECRRYKVARYGPEGNCITPLIEGDGFLDTTGRACSEDADAKRLDIASATTDDRRAALSRDFGYMTGNTPVVYYPHLGDRSAALLLPIKSYEMSPFGSGISYAASAHTYVVVAKAASYWTSQWPTTTPFLVYALHPGGDVRTFAIPWSQQVRGVPHAAIVTRIGLVFVNKNRPWLEEDGWDGIYVLRDQSAVRLYGGDASEIAVSPDGCKVAFDIHHAATGPKFNNYVRSIDLCRRS